MGWKNSIGFYPNEHELFYRLNMSFRKTNQIMVESIQIYVLREMNPMDQWAQISYKMCMFFLKKIILFV